MMFSHDMTMHIVFIPPHMILHIMSTKIYMIYNDAHIVCVVLYDMTLYYTVLKNI